jgi:hypothetical protein
VFSSAELQKKVASIECPLSIPIDRRIAGHFVNARQEPRAESLNRRFRARMVAATVTSLAPASQTESQAKDKLASSVVRRIRQDSRPPIEILGYIADMRRRKHIVA